MNWNIPYTQVRASIACILTWANVFKLKCQTWFLMSAMAVKMSVHPCSRSQTESLIPPAHITYTVKMQIKYQHMYLTCQWGTRVGGLCTSVRGTIRWQWHKQLDHFPQECKMIFFYFIISAPKLSSNTVFSAGHSNVLCFNYIAIVVYFCIGGAMK